jgi:hypothetical protein
MAQKNGAQNLGAKVSPFDNQREAAPASPFGLTFQVGNATIPGLGCLIAKI